MSFLSMQCSTLPFGCPAMLMLLRDYVKRWKNKYEINFSISRMKIEIRFERLRRGKKNIEKNLEKKYSRGVEPWWEKNKFECN